MACREQRTCEYQQDMRIEVSCVFLHLPRIPLRTVFVFILFRRPTARVDKRRVYVESPFGRDFTRRQDAELCVFPKCASLLGSWRLFVAELTLLNCVCSQ